MPFGNDIDINNYEESEEQPWLLDYNVQHSPIEAGGSKTGIVKPKDESSEVSKNLKKLHE